MMMQILLILLKSISHQVKYRIMILLTLIFFRVTNATQFYKHKILLNLLFSQYNNNNNNKIYRMYKVLINLLIKNDWLLCV